MRTLRIGSVAAALMVAALFLAPAASASEPAPQDQVVLSGRVLVPRGQIVGEVVVFHGRVTVLGVVREDVVVLSGGVVVSGQVSGSVIAISGPIRLTSTAQVGGDVISGDVATAETGAQVGGSVRQHATFTLSGRLDALGRFLTGLAVSVSTLLLGLILLLIAPRGADRIFAAATGRIGASVGWGVAVSVGIPVLSGVAAVSLVGLPLALIVLLALALVLFTGYTWTAWVIGRLLVRGRRGRVLAFLAGWAVVRIVGLVPVVSGISWTLGAIFGLGAMTVATWRARGAGSGGGKHRAGITMPEAPIG